MNKVLFRIAVLLIRFIEFNLAADLLVEAIIGLISVLRRRHTH
jgi:hypothetical protein